MIVAAALLTLGLAIFGVPVANSLSASGFQDPAAQSARATELLTDKFNQGDTQLLITVSATDGVNSPAARAAGIAIVEQLRTAPHVVDVASPWTTPPQAAADLVSKDHSTGLIVAGIKGNEIEQQKYAEELSALVTHDRNGVTVRTGGAAMVNVQITKQSQHDLLVMESIAIPLSFLVLLWVFGSLSAAALPVGIGGMAIFGTLAVLRTISFVTDVSIFALNLTTAMGLALAIDYTLLILSRYRDELADGADREVAVARTVVTAGRTVLFSATTVALAMAVMVLFPMHFLKSFAYAGVAVVALAAFAAVVVTPAALILLGDRVNSSHIRRLIRRLVRRPEPIPRPVTRQFWYRWTRFVIRRAVPLGLAGVTVLVFLGLPFLGVKWGFPDDRVLPTSASAHQVVSVELCSLTYPGAEPTVATMVGSALFADGASAVVAVGDQRAERIGAQGPTVVDSRSRLYPDSLTTMGWNFGSSGLSLVLSPNVATLVEKHLSDDLTGFLTGHGLTIDDIDTWVSHPGGPRVIEAITEALELPDDALELTWRSLSEVGNLSSSSVLHVLRDTLAKQPASGLPGVLMAMGPGFCAELVLLRWN